MITRQDVDETLPLILLPITSECINMQKVLLSTQKKTFIKLTMWVWVWKIFRRSHQQQIPIKLSHSHCLPAFCVWCVLKFRNATNLIKNSTIFYLLKGLCFFGRKCKGECLCEGMLGDCWIFLMIFWNLEDIFNFWFFESCFELILTIFWIFGCFWTFLDH